MATLTDYSASHPDGPGGRVRFHGAEVEDPRRDGPLDSGTEAILQASGLGGALMCNGCCRKAVAVCERVKKDGRYLILEPDGAVTKTQYTFVGEGRGGYDILNQYKFVGNGTGTSNILGTGGVNDTYSQMYGSSPMQHQPPDGQGMHMMNRLPMQHHHHHEEPRNEPSSSTCCRCRSVRRECLALTLVLLVMGGICILLSMNNVSPRGFPGFGFGFGGGSEPRVSFNCEEGYRHWRSEWSRTKQDWCCDHESRGCLGSVGELSSPRVHSSTPSWTYHDTAAWPKLYPACDGRAQSPIDIVAAHTAKSMTRQQLSYEYRALGRRTIVNNGHVLYVAGPFGMLVLPDGPDNIASYVVKLLRFHFPSEHMMDGELSTGEMHIVHQKRGSNGTNDLAIIAILLQLAPADAPPREGDPTMSFFRNLGFGRGLPGNAERKVVRGAVDLAVFRKQLDGRYYHYKGSMLAPPCSESVHWYVLKEPAVVSSSIVASFREPFPDPVNRPVQPLHGRMIVDSAVELAGEFPGQKTIKVL